MRASESTNSCISAVLAGMDYVVGDFPSRNCPRGVVANMSLGSSRLQSINDAAAAMTRAGVFLAVAAGNGNIFGIPQNAANYSPASEPSACTVGATDNSDRVASFSNFGALVDLYAPGVSIASLGPGGRTNVVSSGTSMAAPHVAGLGAYFLGLDRASAGNMCSYITSLALQGVISGVPSGTSNLLAQNGLA